MNWKTDAVLSAANHEDAIGEIAAHYFRLVGATVEGASELVDVIYGALAQVEQEQGS